jgi:hypothetical protein
MVEKNQPEREAAKQIKPQIALTLDRCHGAAFLSSRLSSIIIPALTLWQDSVGLLAMTMS